MARTGELDRGWGSPARITEDLEVLGSLLELAVAPGQQP